jgi:hypothetical protein
MENQQYASEAYQRLLEALGIAFSKNCQSDVQDNTATLT